MRFIACQHFSGQEHIIPTHSMALIWQTLGLAVLSDMAGCRTKMKARIRAASAIDAVQSLDSFRGTTVTPKRNTDAIKENIVFPTAFFE